MAYGLDYIGLGENVGDFSQSWADVGGGLSSFGSGAWDFLGSKGTSNLADIGFKTADYFAGQEKLDLYGESLEDTRAQNQRMFDLQKQQLDLSNITAQNQASMTDAQLKQDWDNDQARKKAWDPTYEVQPYQSSLTMF